QLAETVLVAFGERDALVQAEEVEGAVLGAVLDDEDDVIEAVDHVVGQPVELLDDERLERVGVERELAHGVGSPLDRCGASPYPSPRPSSAVPGPVARSRRPSRSSMASSSPACVQPSQW